jgi:hypothetical protein
MTTPASTPTRPKLGDYVRPGDQPQKAKSADVAPKPAETPPPATTDEDTTQLPPEAAKQEQETKSRLSLYEDMSQALLPVKDYAKFLEEQKIEQSKAAEIVDDLLTKGYHEEEYPLTKRTNVVLRTREHLDTLRLHAAIQAQQPVYQDVQQEIVIRYNLAASLAAITGPNGRRFSFSTTETEEKEAHKFFDERLRYIERMPGALFAKISIKLAEFDRLILAVMREGVAEHF